jgi:hypothetical protein
MGFLGFYASLLLSVFFARLFFEIGSVEYGRGYISGLLSVLLSLFAIFTLSAGVLTLIALQATLFCGLWLYNLVSHKGGD